MTLILNGTNGVSDIDGDASTPAIRGTDANTGIFFGSDIIGFSEGGTECARFNADAQFVAAAGTASLPVITTTGDVNTGIFFPAADTIAFAEGGAEAMRIDSSGNVGVGTSSPSAQLEVSRSSTSGYSTMRLSNTGASGRTYEIGLGGNTAAAGYANNLYFYDSTAAAIRMVLDSSGNLGIGTTTPGYLGNPTDICQLSINRVPSSGVITNTGRSCALINLDGSSGGSSIQFGTAAANNTAPTERARITGDGEVYIAGTTDQGAYNLQCNGTGVWGAGAYVNGSDERIKDNIAPIESGLDVVTKLNPVTYRYKESWSKDQSVQTGFIAQELLVALEGQNYVDGIVQQGGSEGYYSVAYQNIIPILTKAIQELKAINDAQASRIETLEAKVAALEAK